MARAYPGYIQHPVPPRARPVQAMDASDTGKVNFGSRLIFVVSLLAFRVSLDLCYIYYMSYAFESHALTPTPYNPDPLNLVLSYLFVFLVGFFLPFDKRNLNGIFFLSASAFLYIPMTSLVGMDASRPVWGLFVAAAALLTSAFFANVRTDRLRLPVPRNGQQIAVGISIIMVVIFLLWTVVSGAASQINLNLIEMYVFREIASDTLDVGIMAYLNLWTQKVFGPFLFAVALYNRKWVYVAALVGLHVYFSLVTQHRIHMFVPVLIYIVYLLYSRRILVSHIYFVIAAALLVFLAANAYFNWEDAAAIVIRRAFFVPASATFDWLWYFDTYSRVYFADNILSSVISNEYTGISLPHYMGDYFLPGYKVAFNVGIVGTGYAQMGILGVLFYATIIGLIVKVVNELIDSGLPVFFSAAILVAPMRTAWADSDLLTAITSHGILVGVLLLWLYGGKAGSAQR